MYQNTELRIAKSLQEQIENGLSRVGLLFRVFSRSKSIDSINKKLAKNPGKYSEHGKKIQDLFGVRVALYFVDDQKVAIDTLKSLFDFDATSSSIDSPNGETFSANRCNLIFKLPDDLCRDSGLLREFKQIDRTFEVQIRTVLSEGWHEVEHDLRYKYKEDWRSHSDLDRALNGIYASLETSDWGVMKLFEELAYRHYKAQEWSQMIRTKFRLRSVGTFSDEIESAIQNTPDLGKKLYRVNRSEVLEMISKMKISFPINPDNIVFFCNFFFIKEEALLKKTPVSLLELFKST